MAWNERHPNWSHVLHYSQLVERHKLTRAWLAELEVAQPAHLLTRGMKQDPHLQATLELLETSVEVPESSFDLKRLSESLEVLLDDTMIQDVLLRIEQAVQVVQAWCVKTLLHNQSSKEQNKNQQAVLLNRLSQTAWRVGREVSLKHWPENQNQSILDLSSVYSALLTTPWNHYLIKRKTHNELSLECLACPHQSFLPEVQNEADTLCSLWVEWIKGFTYNLGNKIAVDYKPTQGSLKRCLLEWSFR